MSDKEVAGRFNHQNAYNQIIARTEKAHRLFSAHWELTYRCNEQCSHCYLDVLPPNQDVPGELSTEECFRVIDEIVELGALNLLLSGGEILARRDFFGAGDGQLALHARMFHHRFAGLLCQPLDDGINVRPLEAQLDFVRLVGDGSIGVGDGDGAREHLGRQPRAAGILAARIRLRG